jgi:BirA family biotin operon repressor/biotin-[acetyl-CoA-carboxylase] ligase
MPKKDNLDPDRIKRNLKTNRIGKEIIVFSSTTSTNDIAAEYARNKANDGLVIFAEEQTAGRGRGGNKWLTGKADSLLCSVLLTCVDISPDLLSLTCAVAVADALGKLSTKETKVKWPNDIYLGHKKIGGILLESKSRKSHTAYIVGIGINCHQTKSSLPEELHQTATSIDIETGTNCDRTLLAKRLLTSIDKWLITAAKGSEKVIDHWRTLSIQLGHRVTLLYNGKEFSGNCIGLDPEKGLILQLDRGGIRMFDAAHTTISK